MQEVQTQQRELIGAEDVARWLTFSSFWGFIFYLLSFLSLIVAQRRQPFQLNVRPLVGGLTLNLGLFVTLGSLASAFDSLRKGKSTTAMARERIGGGSLEQVRLSQGLGAALGAIVPFGLALGSLRLAERWNGEQAIVPDGNTDWPRALGVMALLSGAAALAVTRIVSWVARDAQAGS